MAECFTRAANGLKDQVLAGLSPGVTTCKRYVDYSLTDTLLYFMPLSLLTIGGGVSTFLGCPYVHPFVRCDSISLYLEQDFNESYYKIHNVSGKD